MAIIQNHKRLDKKLKDLIDKGAKNDGVAVVVGFTQNYAVYVHENLEANHHVGEAKFLEKPARELEGELAETIERTYAATGRMETALLVAGLRLQREAQQRTPVDTGALKASAFTAREEDEEAEAERAFRASEAIRQRELNNRSRR